MTRTTHLREVSNNSGGPEGPMLEQRIAALEAKVGRMDVKIDRIDEALRRLEPAIKDIGNKHAELTSRVASVEGYLKALPTFVQLAAMLITTWAAGAAIVFALLKVTHP